MQTSATYNVLNYCPSPVSIQLNRNDSVLISGGSDENPSVYPLTLEEILYVNNSTQSKVFRYGILFFEDEHKEELYEACRIRDWNDIMTDADIEDVILNPTIEKLEKILGITDQMYFNRIYGIFIGLRNSGAGISSKVTSIMTIRYRELVEKKATTGIVLREKQSAQPYEDQKEEIERMRQEMKAMADTIASMSPASTPANEEQKNDDSEYHVIKDEPSVENKSPEKPKKPRTTKRQTVKE